MAPLVTLYVLAGCVAAAAALFVVMLVVSVMRRPQLPSISTIEPPLQRMIRALTPLPFAPAGVPFDEAPTTAMTKTAPTIPARRHAVQMPAVQPQQVPIYAAPTIAVPAAAPTRSPFAPTIALQPSAPAHRSFQEPASSSAPAVRSFPQALPASSPAARSFAQPPPLPPAARTISPAPPVPAPAASPFANLPGFAPSPFVWDDSPPPLAPSPLPTKGRADFRRAVSRPPFPTKKKRWWLRISLGLFITSALAAGAVVAYPAMLDPLCDDYEWFGNDAAQVVREQATTANVAIADFMRSL